MKTSERFDIILIFVFLTFLFTCWFAACYSHPEIVLKYSENQELLRAGHPATYAEMAEDSLIFNHDQVGTCVKVPPTPSHVNTHMVCKAHRQ